MILLIFCWTVLQTISIQLRSLPRCSPRCRPQDAPTVNSVQFIAACSRYVFTSFQTNGLASVRYGQLMASASSIPRVSFPRLLREVDASCRCWRSEQQDQRGARKGGAAGPEYQSPLSSIDKQRDDF